ncbi:MAG: hypothetical protein ACK4OO_04465, partial [bacterium]
MDSLRGRAWLELGKFFQRHYHLTQALECYEKSYQIYPQTSASVEARFNTVDILTLRGKPDLTVELLAPLATHKDFQIRVKAVEKLGDAFYHRKDLERAMAFYDTAAPYSLVARFKSAVVNEKMGRKETALKRFLEVVRSPEAAYLASPPTASQSISSFTSRIPGDDTQQYLDAQKSILYSALLRSAILATELGRTNEARKLWGEVFTLWRGRSDFDRLIWEYLHYSSPIEVDEWVWSVTDSLLAENPQSPWADEIVYNSALRLYGKKDFKAAVERLEWLCSRYPASPYADSASGWIDFIRRYALRGEGLLERMAELSSVPPGKTSPVKWALDWGDFYLDLFKDPVKAVDQYQRALDDINITFEDRLYALQRTIQAFLTLYEASLRENDLFASEMYEDSLLSRLGQFNELTGESEEFLKRWAHWLEINLLFKDLTDGPIIVERERENVLTVAQESIEKYRLEKVSPHMIWIFLNRWLNAEDYLKKDPPKVIAISQRAYESVENENYKGRYKWWQGEFLFQVGRISDALDTFKLVVNAYPQSSAIPLALLRLVKAPGQSSSEQSRWMEILRDQYSYLLLPKELYSLQADIKEKEGEWKEALVWREKAVKMEEWGMPQVPGWIMFDPHLSFQRAVAFKKAGEFNRAEEEIQAILSFAGESDWTPQALIEWAELEFLRMNYQASLKLADSLLQRYPQSSQAQIAPHIKLSVYLNLEQYNRALEVLHILTPKISHPDSLFLYAQYELRCLYRSGR